MVFVAYQLVNQATLKFDWLNGWLGFDCILSTKPHGRRSPETEAFLLFECLNFDLLEDQKKQENAKNIPASKLGSAKSEAQAQAPS